MFDIVFAWFVAIGFTLCNVWTLWKGMFRIRDGPEVWRANQPLFFWCWMSIFLIANVIAILCALARTFGK